MALVFIVGAGFSVGANRFLDRADRGYAQYYPLVSDLSRCFGSRYDLAKGIEAAFLEAAARRDRRPLANLVTWIQSADHYIGSRIAAAQSSPYASLIDAFPGSTFVSFNYDCLLELLLYTRGLWTPRDGFGVECDALIDDSYVNAERPPATSSVTVLHPHGSLYLYAQKVDFVPEPHSNMIWLREPQAKRFRFDADALGNHFIPFRSGAAGLGYVHTEHRVVVPVPDKADALADDFVRLTYVAARKAISSASTLVAIGYRFAECDRSSYRPLLQAFMPHGTRVHVVAPDAAEIAARLRKQRLPNVTHFEGSLDAWETGGFRDLL